MNAQEDSDKKEIKQKITAFFIMPAEALPTLRSEISPLASDMAVKAILFRYGFRCGEACVQSMDIDEMSAKKIKEMLPSLWDEIGLGRLGMDASESDEFTLELNESIEADANGEMDLASCDFTRGYLAGIVSYLSGKGYHCKEEECVSLGDSHCTFLLSIRGEGVE
jgi:predicted hydrocarbon binding protein